MPFPYPLDRLTTHLKGASCEVERLFRRLKGFRRIFSRFDKLYVLFPGSIQLADIFEALR